MGIIGKITDAVVPIGTPLVAVGFIIAGFLYISASASPERMALAKKALIAAIIGTILIILASQACTFIAALFGLPAESCKSGTSGGDGGGLNNDRKVDNDIVGTVAQWEIARGLPVAKDTAAVWREYNEAIAILHNGLDPYNGVFAGEGGEADAARAQATARGNEINANVGSGNINNK